MQHDITFSSVVLAVLVVSLGLATIAIWMRIAKGLRAGLQPLPFEPRAAAVPNSLVTTLVAAYALVNVVGHVVASFQRAEVEPSLRGVQMACSINVFIFVLLLAMLKMPLSSRLSEFGITLNGWRRAAMVGVLGFVASLLPVYSVQLILAQINRLIPFRSEQPQHSFLQFVTNNADPAVVAWVAVAAVILAPLAEELMFRVVIQGWLESREKPAAAITTTALLFSVIHGLPDAIGLFPLALILGYVYHRTHRYLAVVVLHALFNAFNLSMVLLARPDQAEAVTTRCLPIWLTAALSRAL